MKTKLLNVVAVAFVVVAVLAAAGCSQRGRGEIVIGAVAPMTGQYGEMGKDLLAAIEMAVEEQNEAGGIDGRKIRLVMEDDKASPKDAVTVAQRLVADAGVIGIVGHMNSGTMLPASSVYSESGMPVIMPVPTNPQITRQGFTDLFRVPITDDKQGPACVDFAIDRLGKKAVAVLHNKQAYGEGIASEVQKALVARGLQPVLYEGLNADDKDFRPVITRLTELKPDAVFFGSGYAEAALLIKQSRELGLGATFLMGDGCFDSQLMTLAGAAADGAYISNIAPISAPGERAKSFYSKFEAKHGKIVAFAPLGYVSAKILLDAIQKANEKTRAGVLKVLREPTYSYDSILGGFSFEPNGDSKGHRLFMHVIEGGKFKTVSW